MAVNGEGALSNASPLSFLAAGDLTKKIAVADVEGDGRLDLLVATVSQAELFFDAATFRPTKQSTKVKTVSVKAARPKLKPLPSARANVAPWCIA